MSSQKLPELLDIWQQTLEWQPTQQQQLLLEKVYQQILLTNQQINLTRITTPEAFWEKHLWDSLAGLMKWNLTQRLDNHQSLQVIDIGTGAGFPGIPIAITFSFWTVTLLDSTQKKVTFLQELINALNLKNVKTLRARAENIHQHKLYKKAYDLATIRAVGSANLCAQYTLPFLKSGGMAILYRGNWSETEAKSLQSTLTKYESEIYSIEQFYTPLTHSLRHCIYLKKL